MADMASSNAVELLGYFHEELDLHFAALRDARTRLNPKAPVFALEHDLSPDDLGFLIGAVRAAIKTHYITHYEKTWLPFVVYAAEMGYGYAGGEYWTTFSSLTPRWETQERSTIRDWFMQFCDHFDGARPTGAWAIHRPIISWPITHAVLPIYLQRYLAQLLFEFGGAPTSDLLDDPVALGIQLARRTSNYTERFRIFCQNSMLVGQVAVALLSGENEPTPYLSAPTLTRIVNGLSEESQARYWLKSARASARRVRGFRSGERAPAIATTPKNLPRATDPRLFLRYDGGWNAFAELPDLTVLGAESHEIFSQLRMSRATVNGGARPIFPSGLLYPGQEARLARWPRPDQPFLQLDRGDAAANGILAAQCVISKGPWWLFSRKGSGLAVEVKGKFIRPGHHYVLVGPETIAAPAVPWCVQTAIGVADVKAYDLQVPPHLGESEEAALLNAGLSVVSHVAIRPVGIVARAWDGEGEVEWLAGEPAMLGISSDLVPKRARVIIAGSVYFLEWTAGETELLFMLEDLPVGAHELSLALLGEGDRHLASGTLVVTVRDPQVRPECASIGEGIRLQATPSRPTMAELWDDRTVITVGGPVDTEATLRVTLFDERSQSMAAECKRSVRLPLEEADWRLIAKAALTDQPFTDAYDSAESCVISMARDGVGFATLTCERGFQPLRWRFARHHDGHVTATLIDRTDGGATSLDFYDVEAPLVVNRKDPSGTLAVPPRGGLAVAMVGDTVVAAILPTNPKAAPRMPPRPIVMTTSQTPGEVLRLAEGHRRWLDADLPADAIAAYQRQIVGDAIAGAIGTLIGGSHWAAIERKLTDVQDACDSLDAMQDAVGISTEHKAIASTIAYRLYRWLKPEDLLSGFHEVISPHLAGYGLKGRRSVPRFLLMLAGRPGYITEWEPGEAALILKLVLMSPVLYRAARFAVLGTRALNDAEGLERGF